MRKDGALLKAQPQKIFWVLDLGSKGVMFMGFMDLVRKEGYSKGKMKFVELDLNSNSSPCNKKKEDLEKRNEELSMKYNENNNLLKTVVTQFSEFLDVMRNGNAYGSTY
ncbi:30S ribosomal protein S3 [Bienertia sinuspersici]